MSLSCAVWCAMRVARTYVYEREKCRSVEQKFVRDRVGVRIRVHVTDVALARGLTCVGRLSEQPVSGWPKHGAQGNFARWPGELSGQYEVYRSRMRPAEGAVPFQPIRWLYSTSVLCRSGLHRAMATPYHGIPCFGHCPKKNTLGEIRTRELAALLINKNTCCPERWYL